MRRGKSPKLAHTNTKRPQDRDRKKKKEKLKEKDTKRSVGKEWTKAEITHGSVKRTMIMQED